MTISIFIVRYTESRYGTHLPNLPDKLVLQIRMNDAIVKRTQTRDINDSLVQADKTFDVEVLCDSVLAVRAVLRSGVHEGADRSNIVGGLEPADAVGLRDRGVWIFRGQEEDDDVETGPKSVFFYIDPNGPTKPINCSPYMTIIQ